MGATGQLFEDWKVELGKAGSGREEGSSPATAVLPQGRERTVQPGLRRPFLPRPLQSKFLEQGFFCFFFFWGLLGFRI